MAKKKDHATFGLQLPAELLKKFKILSLELNLSTTALLERVVSRWWDDNGDKIKDAGGAEELLAWLREKTSPETEEPKEESDGD